MTLVLLNLFYGFRGNEYDFRCKGEIGDVLLVFLDLFDLDELVFALLPLDVAVVEGLVVDAVVLGADF